MQNSQPKTESIFNDSKKKKKNRWSTEQMAKMLHQHPSWPTSRKEAPGEGVGDGNTVGGKVRFYFPVLSVSTLQNSTEENWHVTEGAHSSQLIKELSEPLGNGQIQKTFPALWNQFTFLEIRKGTLEIWLFAIYLQWDGKRKTANLSLQ